MCLTFIGRWIMRAGDDNNNKDRSGAQLVLEKMDIGG